MLNTGTSSVSWFDTDISSNRLLNICPTYCDQSPANPSDP